MGTYKLEKFLINSSALLYFVLLLAANQINGHFIHIIFYISLVLCCLTGILFYRFRIFDLVNKLFILSVLCLTGIVNHYLRGYTSRNDFFFLVLFYFTSFTLINKSLSEKTILFAVWLNIIVVMYRFMTVGIYGQIFQSASSNFVSVYLLYPTAVYYSLVAKNKKNTDINLIPALLVWILCLFARGRGGIITITFFVSLLYLLKYKSLHSFKKLIAVFLMFLLVGVIVYNLDYILFRLNSSAIMEFFKANALRSSRTRFWPEYIKAAKSDLKSFIIGADVSHTFIGTDLENNPHNSFIEIHMKNGIIGLAIVVFMIIRTAIYSIQRRDYLFFICFVTLLLRGFTDHVLWAAYGTPILFYFLFNYDNKSTKVLKKMKNIKKKYSSVYFSYLR